MQQKPNAADMRRTCGEYAANLRSGNALAHAGTRGKRNDKHAELHNTRAATCTAPNMWHGNKHATTCKWCSYVSGRQRLGPDSVQKKCGKSVEKVWKSVEQVWKKWAIAGSLWNEMAIA